MYFDFSSKSSLLLVLVAVLLLFAAFSADACLRQRDRASGWLTLLLFLAAAHIAPFMFGYAGWYGKQPYRNILFYLPLQQLLLIPPVFYAYIEALLYPDRPRRTMGWLHFVPALLYALFSAWVFLSDIVFENHPLFYADQRDMDFDPWYQWMGFLFLLAYTIASIFRYRGYRRHALDQWSYADEVRYTWIRDILVLLLLLLSLRVIFFVCNPEWAQFGRKFWYYGAFGMLMAFLGIKGLLRSARWNALTRYDRSRLAGNPISPPTTEPELDGVAMNSPQVLADLPVLMQALDSHMRTARPYMEPMLTLNDLAAPLQLAPKKLSQLINQGYGQNFNEFVNQYRVRAVVEKFEEGEHSLQTLLGIAYDCGFNSKSTFNRAFLRHTGLSPSAYLEKLRKN